MTALTHVFSRLLNVDLSFILIIIIKLDRKPTEKKKKKKLSWIYLIPFLPTGSISNFTDGTSICNLRFADIDLMGGGNGELEDLTNRLVDRATTVS